MINVIKQSGKDTAYVIEYVADKETDLADIDTNDCVQGSTCFVIENSSVYMLDSNKVWQAI